MTVTNVLRNMVRPGYGSVMLGKVLRRFEADTSHEATEWSKSQATRTEVICRSIDSSLWDEAERWFVGFKPGAQARLSEVGVNLGGGGNARLLYFLTRKMRPEHVVETGVAAGWSSSAILAAMDANGTGTLHSSDFPYFRLSEPERYVGVLVPSELRDRWRLHLRGDRLNLPAIVKRADRIDLFHFDSDKSVAGRKLAMRIVTPHLTARAVTVMDDIHNNTYFRSLAVGSSRPWCVTDGHVGILGLEPPPNGPRTAPRSE